MVMPRFPMAIFIIVACLCGSTHGMKHVWFANEDLGLPDADAPDDVAPTPLNPELAGRSLAQLSFVRALFKAPDRIPSLLQEGADPNAVAIYQHAPPSCSLPPISRTPQHPRWQHVFRHVLHIAIRVSPARTIEALLQAGSDPNAIDFDGTPALHIATRAKRMRCPDCQPPPCRCRPRILEHLFSYGAQANMRDGHGDTALHRTLVTPCDGMEEAAVLLHYGANPFLRYPNRESPLEYAALHGWARRVEQMLIETRIPLDIDHVVTLREESRTRGAQLTRTARGGHTVDAQANDNLDKAASMLQIVRLLQKAEHHARSETGCHCAVQ